ncbi:type II toxin-antitoxin system TacA family antitoxin [Actinotalea solisilvae]|uniref:type II toxin-antitoxin system TacA family antitoxin n=1 Tax=Actinotalea solisilvae TaxID=2072922 RepID=UPI0018F13618|nr:DUF1778 domain-containing protein [Actinotalea solisilvae]
MDTMTAATTSERSSRLNMRIAPDALETLREAAAAQQQDLTSFVLGASMERARAVLMEERVMRLTPSEVERLEAAMDRDPIVVPELAALVRQVQDLKVSRRAAAHSTR